MSEPKTIKCDDPAPVIAAEDSVDSFVVAGAVGGHRKPRASASASTPTPESEKRARSRVRFAFAIED